MYELYKSVTGSKLYGTSTPSSDDDFTVLYLPSLKDLVCGKKHKSFHYVDKHTGLDFSSRPLQEWFLAVVNGQSQAVELMFSWTNPAASVEDNGLNMAALSRQKGLLNRSLKGMNGMVVRTLASEKATQKDVSHALRVVYQMEELHTTGRLVFPLKNAEFLVSVKLGRDVSLQFAKALLESGYGQVKKLEENSVLPELSTFDWEGFVYNLYKTGKYE